MKALLTEFRPAITASAPKSSAQHILETYVRATFMEQEQFQEQHQQALYDLQHYKASFDDVKQEVRRLESENRGLRQDLSNSEKNSRDLNHAHTLLVDEMDEMKISCMNMKKMHKQELNAKVDSITTKLQLENERMRHDLSDRLVDFQQTKDTQVKNRK